MLLLLSVFVPDNLISKTHRPVAEKGVLDLREWNFETNGSVILSGEWEFYWQKLLSPDVFSHNQQPLPSVFSTPKQSWNKLNIAGEALSGEGYATYRIKVLINQDTQNFALKLREIRTAYRVYINGNKIAEVGQVGNSKEVHIPKFFMQTVNFRVEEEVGKLEIIIQTSNFNHKIGGMWQPVTLGRQTQLSKLHENLLAQDLIVFGGTLIMGLSHLAMFFLFRRRDKAPLYMALITLLAAARTLIQGEAYLFLLFPSISWESLMFLSYATFYPEVPLFLLYFKALFPDELKNQVLKIFLGISSIFLLLLFLTPATTYQHSLQAFQIFTVLTGIFAIYIMFLAIRKGRDGALLMVTGFIVLFITLVNDILFYDGILNTGLIASFGLLIFIFFQVILVWKRFSAMFFLTEKLTFELEAKNQRLLALDRQKDDFLASTSHELITPLHGMIGLAEAAVKNHSDSLTASLNTDLELIVSSGQRLSNLVIDLLDLSKLKNENLILKKNKLDIRPLVSGVLELSRFLLHEKPIKLVNAIPSEIHSVLGDENRIQQILHNLLSNAIKFTDSGEIVIEASLNGKMVIVSVSDTGKGLPESEKEKIYQAYHQVESDDDPPEGSGLGLYISRKLVELHGGELNYKNNKDSGTVFSFTLPIYSDHAVMTEAPVKVADLSEQEDDWKIHTANVLTQLSRDQEIEPQNKIIPGSNSAFEKHDELIEEDSGPLILVVDDEPINLRIITSQLELEHFQVICVSDSTEVLGLIEEKKPDLILLDVIMPKINGFELCREIRKRHDMIHLPIILLTARHRIEDMAEGLKNGANDYLTKPFRKEALLARMQSQLEAKYSVERLHENQQLMQEIRDRKLIEYELRDTQHQMHSIMDRLEEGVIFLADDLEITFLNQQALTWLGIENYGMDGKQSYFLKTLLPDLCYKAPNIHHISEWNEEEFDAFNLQINIQSIDATEKSFNKLWVTIHRLDSKDAVYSIVLRTTQLETKSSPLWAKDIIQNPTDHLLKSHRFREKLVKVTQLSLHHWEKDSNKDKAEMALQSKLWTVQIDREINRTRTLDKYTEMGTLPQNPRWKKVIQTAQYVLEKCPKSSSVRKNLEKEVEGLIHMLDPQ